MNPQDMREPNFKIGQVVDLTGHFENEERCARHFIVVPYDIPRGCTATYFREANILVPIGSTADRSNTPVSKFVRITVEPHESKTHESETVGKFDYDYVEGYANTAADRSLSHRSKTSFLSKINFKNVVGVVVWATVVVVTAKTIYKSQIKK